MTKVRLLIRIVAITIVIIFLMVCITAGIFLLMEHYDYETEKLFLCYDFGQDVYAAARYYCWPYPPSDNWIECLKVKYVQRYLRNEKVKEIAFGMVKDEHNVNSLRIWGRGIVEPEKIKRVLQLISTAKKDINVSIVWCERMIIITDKHKFVVPIGGGDKAVYGWDWTSKELRKKLWEWGYDRKVYKYDLPPKEQTVAILLYPHHYNPVHPLAIFSDAEEILSGIWIKDREGKKIRFNKYVFGEELKPKKIFEGRDWLEKIMDAYERALKEAKERERYYPMEFNPVGRIVFMTQDEDYWKEIGIDENTVFDDYIKSERLKAYFDELGLTKELLAGEPNKIPQN